MPRKRTDTDNTARSTKFSLRRTSRDKRRGKGIYVRGIRHKKKQSSGLAQYINTSRSTARVEINGETCTDNSAKNTRQVFRGSGKLRRVTATKVSRTRLKFKKSELNVWRIHQ